MLVGGVVSVVALGGGATALILDNGSTAPQRPAVEPSDLHELRSLAQASRPPASPPASQTTLPASQTLPAAPTTEAVPQPPASQAGSSAPGATSTFFGPSAGRQVYITIDDGWFPDRRVIDLIRSENVPITTFLIAAAASEHLGFWKAFVAAGGQIQNHTYSHPNLTRLTQGAAESQWARTNQDFASWFGHTPTIGRPPYGAVDDKVALAARAAGLDSMIMWSALDDGAGIQTWNDRPIAPGSIILLHWDTGLHAELLQVLQAVDDHHLVPAFLAPV
jgi:peptidoglycan/xylan/chitin deacetylase (PgdA/CDA1 family)